MTQTPSYQGDVVIAGGGLAGMTLALAMDQAGLTVALVDVLEMDEQIAPEFDGRASALAYTSWRMFEALGVAEYLRPHTQRIEHILVCDGRPYGGDKPGGPGPHSLHFDRREISDGDDGEPLGWMAENRHSRFALIQALKSKPGISVFAPARADRYETRGDGVDLYLDDGRILSGQLLVACDGKFSRLRKQAAIRTAGWQYGQKGVVATVRHSEPHNGVAYEYFLPSGPFAILPLPDNRASLVWTEPDAIADALRMHRTPSSRKNSRTGLVIFSAMCGPKAPASPTRSGFAIPSVFVTSGSPLSATQRAASTRWPVRASISGYATRPPWRKSPAKPNGSALISAR